MRNVLCMMLLAAATLSGNTSAQADAPPNAVQVQRKPKVVLSEVVPVATVGGCNNSLGFTIFDADGKHMPSPNGAVQATLYCGRSNPPFEVQVEVKGGVMILKSGGDGEPSVELEYMRSK